MDFRNYLNLKNLKNCFRLRGCMAEPEKKYRERLFKSSRRVEMERQGWEYVEEHSSHHNTTPAQKGELILMRKEI